MAYSEDGIIDVAALKSSLLRVKQTILTEISKSGHAKFQKVDAVPEAAAAEENVLYLVKNTGTNHYDIYAKIDGAMELLDDTTVSLDDYVTEEALAEALSGLGGGALYTGTKTDLEASDSAVIEAYFAQHSEVTPKAGDVFLVTTIVDAVTYEKSSYQYTGTDWEAVTGPVDANKVMLRDDIILAGNYSQVGNITKSANGTATLPAKGKSVADVLTEMLSKRLQPGTPTQPSISGFALTGAKAVEAGTKLAQAGYTAATLNKGSYQYGPDNTGVVATNWKVERITDQGTVQVASEDAASLTAGTDNNGGAGFQIGDQGGEGVVNSLKYKLTVTHGAGVTAKDNVLYLVMNSGTGHYDIYAKVEGEVVLLDDATVDLSNYVQKDGDKVLSDNNYTDAEKSKLAGLSNYSHPTHSAHASGFYKVTVDNQGHVTDVTAVTKDDITALGIPGQDTTYGPATSQADGLMSKADKSKLDGMVVASDDEVTEMLNEVFPTA